MKEPIRILLAEDNHGDVLLVREALEENRLSYDLHITTDGLEAASYIERIDPLRGVPCPDLLLLDLNLPKQDGFELLNLIRAHPLCHAKPVIVITSSGAPRDRERVTALSARFFRKPADLDEFMKLGVIVREVVEGAA